MNCFALSSEETTGGFCLPVYEYYVFGYLQFYSIFHYYNFSNFLKYQMN